MDHNYHLRFITNHEGYQITKIIKYLYSNISKYMHCTIILINNFIDSRKKPSKLIIQNKICTVHGSKSLSNTYLQNAENTSTPE